jgi:GT2 family glycosyltransferase
MPKFSVILPVCHGGKFLTQALATLAHLTAPSGGFEILVAGEKKAISDPSIFNSSQAELRIVESKGNRSEILNTACAAARGSVWVFADDDCVFPTDWLLNVERSLIAHSNAAVMGGADTLGSGAGVFDLALDEVLNSFSGTGGARQARTVRVGQYYPKLWNMTVLSSAAKQAALDALHQKLIFDPSLNVHEDVDFVRRIEACGGTIVYAPEVLVTHYRDTNLRSFFTRNMGMAEVCRKLRVHSEAHLALVLVITGIPLLGFLSLVYPSIIPLFVGAAGLYAAAVIFAGIAGAWRKKNIVLLFMIPALLISLHVARAKGYLLTIRIKDNSPL